MVLLALAAVSAAMAFSGEYKPARQGKRTLVIHEESSAETIYKTFFDSLAARGHDLTLKPSSSKIDLVSYGEDKFDNIVLFAPSADSFSGLKTDDFTSFTDRGGNILVAGSSSASSDLRKLAHAYGVDFDASRTKVIDHFSYDASSDEGQHTKVLTSSYFRGKHVVGPKLPNVNDRYVIYEGAGLTMSPDNILALRILTASPTGYSAYVDEAIKEYPQSAGADTVLVAGIQARSNARAVFVGSAWMFSDEAVKTKVLMPGSQDKAKRSVNGEFTNNVSAWAFQEIGVLKASNLRHSKTDGTPAEKQVAHNLKKDLPLSMFPQPEIAQVSYAYRVKDDVVFAVDVHEATLEGNSTTWTPYEASDMQLEFIMQDPYIRKNLVTKGDGTFSVEFKVPDIYGVFHFRVQYRRPGYSVITLKDQVTVRPFRHNEFERFIVSAYPYYASAFIMIAGVFVFSFLYLFGDNKHQKQHQKKE